MRVSVIIPCYNAERFIAETLESILAQSRPPDEIIVADDCSTDRSREVVARFPGVTLLTHATNVGCAGSRNRAIAASTGDLVAIIDSDDMWYRDHLEQTVGLLERIPEAGFAFSGIHQFGLECMDRWPDFPAGVALDVLTQLVAGNVIYQPTVVFRRELLETTGAFDAGMRYCEDYDLWLRFACRSLGVFTGGVTAGYRIHGTQLNQHHPQMFSSTWHARFKLLDELRVRDPGRAQDVEARLGVVWTSGLYTAWAVRSRESLDFMLSIAGRFPQHAAAARRWRLRRRTWFALNLAARASRHFPSFLRRIVRPEWSLPVGRRPMI